MNLNTLPSFGPAPSSLGRIQGEATIPPASPPETANVFIRSTQASAANWTAAALAEVDLVIAATGRAREKTNLYRSAVCQAGRRGDAAMMVLALEAWASRVEGDAAYGEMLGDMVRSVFAAVPHLKRDAGVEVRARLLDLVDRYSRAHAVTSLEPLDRYVWLFSTADAGEAGRTRDQLEKLAGHVGEALSAQAPDDAAQQAKVRRALDYLQQLTPQRLAKAFRKDCKHASRRQQFRHVEYHRLFLAGPSWLWNSVAAYMKKEPCSSPEEAVAKVGSAELVALQAVSGDWAVTADGGYLDYVVRYHRLLGGLAILGRWRKAGQVLEAADKADANKARVAGWYMYAGWIATKLWHHDKARVWYAQAMQMYADAPVNETSARCWRESILSEVLEDTASLRFVAGLLAKHCAEGKVPAMVMLSFAQLCIESDALALPAAMLKPR